jgi:uncharacterized protein
VSLTMPQTTPGTSAAGQRWLWSQGWRDLLFAHWEVSAAALRPFIPDRLEIDTWEGTARVSVVAFRLDRVRRRWLPPAWPTAAFPELNLRTYVCHRGQPGIYFLSIHAGRWLANCLARSFTPLPYVYSPIRFHHLAGSRRFDCASPGFAAEWSPEGPAVEARPGSLDRWLLERYALYVEDVRGTFFRTDVEHAPWVVRRARLTIDTGSLGAPFGLDLSRMPDAVHCSAGVHALIRPFTAVAVGKPTI